MKLLVTTRADSNIKDFTDITHPLIQQYANSIGADFKVLDHMSDCYHGNGDDPIPNGKIECSFKIFKLYDLFEDYDRIVQIDSDMLLTPSLPNIFEQVPYDKIGTIFEDRGSRINARRSVIQAIQYKFGFVDWNKGYINTGMIVASKMHRDIFKTIAGQYWTHWGYDDAQIGYLIRKHNFEIFDLNYKWNHTPMWSESWNNNADRFDSYVIHYGGSGIFDKGVKNKLEQITLDYNRLYPNGI
jgi:hypothetical protein